MIIPVLALFAFVSRRPDLWLAPQFWAEDGKIFFSDAATLGWGAWLLPYAGYLHLFPRTVACATIHVPWEHLPSLYVWSAALAGIYVATRVACSRLPPWPRVVGALAVVGVPHNGEVFLNLTNVNWILALLLLLNLLEPAPATRAEAVRRTIEVLIAGLSGPVIVLLSPLVLLWALRMASVRVAWPIGIAYLGAALIQGGVILGSRRPVSENAIGMFAMLHWLIPDFASAVFVGRWRPVSLGVGSVIAVVSILIVGGSLVERNNPHRHRAFLLLLFAGVLLVAARYSHGWWDNPLSRGARYTYVPIVMFVWALAWIIEGSRHLVPRTCVALLLVCLCVLHLLRLGGPAGSSIRLGASGRRGKERRTRHV